MLDKFLQEKREKYSKLLAPEYMEESLKKALNDQEFKKKNNRLIKLASFLIIGSLILGFNSSTIADYIRNYQDGTEIVESYSDLVSTNIKEISNSDKLVKINKSLTFKDGSEVRIDGILMDKLGSTIFYKYMDGSEDSNISLAIIDGQSRYSSGNARGIEEGDTSKWASYIEGEIKGENIEMELNNLTTGENKRIPVIISDDLKINTIKEIRVNKKIKGLNHKIKRIKITPLSIQVEGTIENIFELGLKSVLNKRDKLDRIDINLLIDGESISDGKMSSFTSDWTGSYFSFRFDDYPRDIDSIGLEVLDSETGELIDLIDIDL